MEKQIPLRAPAACGRAHDYPELEAAEREAILQAFNVDNPFFPGLLDLRVVDVRWGYARLEVDNRRQLRNPAGVMHGGAIFGLADTAVAAALAGIYGPGKALLTVEMKMNYLEPILPGRVVAEAYVLRAGRASAYAEADVRAGNQLAARATTTYMIRDLTAQGGGGA